jgi:hypothetical protein
VTDEPHKTDEQSFAAFLCQHARGRTERELSAKLRELVEAVEETGKGGSITYVLSVKPQAQTEHAVLVTDEIKTKLPQLDRPASIFFADERYRLVRTDPRQLSFESAFTEESA